MVTNLFDALPPNGANNLTTPPWGYPAFTGFLSSQHPADIEEERRLARLGLVVLFFVLALPSEGAVTGDASEENHGLTIPIQRLPRAEGLPFGRRNRRPARCGSSHESAGGTGESRWTLIRPRIIRILSIGKALLAIGSVIVYAAIVEFRQDGSSEYIGLRGGPAQLTARGLRTPVGETTGLWHYHPGYVYNVVTQGRITIEDGCGQVREYSKGQAFETSEGRVHRAYNLGSEDAIEYNMFVGPPGRPIGINIPNNEHRCGPPSTIGECTNDGWVAFNHPARFANQGECVAYVNHRKRITLLVPEDPIQ